MVLSGIEEHRGSRDFRENPEQDLSLLCHIARRRMTLGKMTDPQSCLSQDSSVICLSFTCHFDTVET